MRRNKECKEELTNLEGLRTDFTHALAHECDVSESVRQLVLQELLAKCSINLQHRTMLDAKKHTHT